MNTNRLLAGLAVALVVAFLLSTFVYRQFKKAGNVPSVSMQTLVVANRPLTLGTRLDESNLHTIPWPANQPVSGMYTRVQDCVGRAVLTDVAANEPILESKLAPIQAGVGLPATIPEGMRAISVAVNEVVGVAGFVAPGTMVDVLVTGRIVGQVNGNSNITKVILQNVKVLAAGQKVEQDREGKPQTVPVITLLVTPEDAATLAMGSTQGKIQLALRNTIDTAKSTTAPVMEAALFSPAGAVGSLKPEINRRRVTPSVPPAYVVEVITGNKRESKSFPSLSER
jgi:pilus assembly protein CpaB